MRPIQRRAKAAAGDKVRGYLQADLEALFSRWLSPAPNPSEPGAPGTESADQVLEPLRSVPSPICEPDTEKPQPGTEKPQPGTPDIGGTEPCPESACRCPGSDEICPESDNSTRDAADQVLEPLPESCPGCPESKEVTDKDIPPYRYVVTDAALADAIHDIAQSGAVALDIETYYPDAKLTKTGKRQKVAVDTICDRYKSKIRLLSLYRDGSPTVWLIDIRALESAGASFTALRETLAAKTIIGHNVTCFDLPWLWEHLRVRVTQINDTLTADRLLTNGMRESDGTDTKSKLDLVAKRYLDLDLTKDEAKSDWGVPELTAEQLAYAANDVFRLHDLLRSQEAAIVAAKLDKPWKLEQRLAPIVVDMTNRGFPFNVTDAAKPKAEIERRLMEAEQRARVWFGDPSINLNSHQQLLPAFAAKGVTLSGTSEDVLRANGSEGALLLLDYRNIRDKELKFLNGLSDATASDGRIHATFQSVGTDTGRFSCKDPNLQNVPRPSADRYPVRALFQAPPGRKFVIADFSQMELVAAAVIAPEPKMLAAIAAGEDLHLRTASIILGRPATSKDRSLAKAVNFGLLFGQRADGLRAYAKNTYGVDMTADESEQFRTAFFAEYTGLADWHAQAWRDARDLSTTEVRTRGVKRGRLLPDIEKCWQRFSTLVNTPVQGSCAEVGKLAMLDIAKQLEGKAALVNVVHDEIVVECAESDAAEVQDAVVRIMKKRFADVFNGTPVGVEANIVDDWSEKGGKKPALALAA